jgi:hypothetical protein
MSWVTLTTLGVFGFARTSRTVLALGNSGYEVVASADAIIDLIAAF